MNMNDIEEEIYEFSNLFFKDIDKTVEEGIALINDNQLFQPKENYIIIIEYLNTVVNHFKNLDYSIVDETLKKLHRDVISLHKLHKIKTEQTTDVREIFKHKFLNKSPIINDFSAEILKLKNLPNKSDKDLLTHKKLIKDFQELQNIYYESFKNIFVDDKKYFLNALLIILNTKTFYLDRLLWIQAAKSELIMRSLKTIKTRDTGINSRLYIAHRLKIIIPYSKDYQYLQKCLKVFK